MVSIFRVVSRLWFSWFWPLEEPIRRFHIIAAILFRQRNRPTWGCVLRRTLSRKQTRAITWNTDNTCFIRENIRRMYIVAYLQLAHRLTSKFADYAIYKTWGDCHSKDTSRYLLPIISRNIFSSSIWLYCHLTKMPLVHWNGCKPVGMLRNAHNPEDPEIVMNYFVVDIPRWIYKHFRVYVENIVIF